MEASVVDADHGSSGAKHLLDRLHAGDQAVFADVVAAFDADMVRLCFVVSGDREVARDATQNAWTRLWHEPPKLREPGKLKAWLLTVAANEARQMARRQRTRSLAEERARAMPADGGAADDLLWFDVQEVLAKLSLEERQLLGLRYLLDLSSQEIGGQLGLSAVAVRSRLHRLLERIRGEFDE